MVSTNELQPNFHQVAHPTASKRGRHLLPCDYRQRKQSATQQRNGYFGVSSRGLILRK